MKYLYIFFTFRRNERSRSQNVCKSAVQERNQNGAYRNYCPFIITRTVHNTKHIEIKFARQTNCRQVATCRTMSLAFFKRVSLQYSKITFQKQKPYLHSLYFSQNMLILSEPRRVPVICNLFLDFARKLLLSKFFCPAFLSWAAITGRGTKYCMCIKTDCSYKRN